MNGITRLTWSVLNAAEVERFVIERKVNESTWEVIKIVNPANNSSTYTTADVTPQKGNNFYRLRIIETDQQIHYSSTRKIVVTDKNSNINIYPNPARRNITVKGLSSNETLLILDLAGKIVHRQQLPSGQGERQVALPQLVPGMYIIRIREFTERLAVY